MADARTIIARSDLTFLPVLRLTKRMEDVEALPARASEADSFRALVEQHSAMVFRLAFRITGNEEDAEDVVQESFLKAHRAFRQFDARSSFATWIYRIAFNSAIDVIRRRHPEHIASPRALEPGATDPLESLPSAEPLPDRVAFGSQVESRVASALRLLSPLERAAFVLRHLDGLPIEKIAFVLRSRPNAVKQTVFRAVQKLRRELAPLVGAR